MVVLPLLAVIVQALSGAPVDALSAPAGTKAIVFLFTSTDCPVSNRYAPEVRRLADEFAAKGVVFRLVYPGSAEDAKAIREHMTAYGYTGAFDAVRDPKLDPGEAGRRDDYTRSGRLRRWAAGLQGRIDDRFVDLGRERPAPTQHDLFDALTAIVAGKPALHPTTQAVGCYISDLAR